MKSLLTRLSYALFIAIFISLNTYRGGAASGDVLVPNGQGERTKLGRASDPDGLDPLPQVEISTPAAFVKMKSGASKSILFTFTETGNGAGLVTGYTYRFYTQHGESLGEVRGPYQTSIQIRPLQDTEWKGQVSLPERVVTAARGMGTYAIVLKAEFNGDTPLGKDFSAEASVLLLLDPAAFGKVSPVSGSLDLPSTLTLEWSSSVGAVDYEYCFDTVNNGRCDTAWKGTYDTHVTLQGLPPATTHYWLVRANNLAGKTASDGGAWWSFTTGGTCLGDSVTVKNTNDYGPGSLRQAFDEVCPGGTIIFDPSLAGKTIPLSSKLILQKDLNIDGSALKPNINISGSNRLTVIEIRPETTVRLTGLIIKEGHAPQNGGGIYNSGALTVINCTFKNNWADRNGGGIYNTAKFTTGYAGTLNVSNSIYMNNSARYSGGGIYHGDGSMDVTNSTFSGNSSYSGGGIFNWRGPVRVANSTFINNTANSSGGGIYHNGNTLTLANSTFSENAAMQGGALYQFGILDFSNNILANSPWGGDCYSEDGTGIRTNTRNLIENNAPAPNHCGFPHLSTDPNLGALANNGGPTQTLALLAGSPAIDAGDNAACESKDQRGARRPIDGDRNGAATCDLGAFEYRPPSNLRSVAAQDGWLLESGERTNQGGALNKTATTFFLGDNAQRKQYRAILSFNTQSLPDKAVITKVILKVRKQGVVGGGNPVNLFQGFLVDIRKGFFGPAPWLQAGDFQAGAHKSFGPFKPALSNGWYSFNLTAAGGYINTLATNGGVTQIRLRFKLDDNNDAVANHLKLYSGNAPVESRPQLVIEYFVP